MSAFYETLPYHISRAFKKRKQQFKKNKPCAICGQKLSPECMMVAHIKPVRELADVDALFDERNWEVRCIYCERKLNHEEDIKKNEVSTDM